MASSDEIFAIWQKACNTRDDLGMSGVADLFKPMKVLMESGTWNDSSSPSASDQFYQSLGDEQTQLGHTFDDVCDALWAQYLKVKAQEEAAAAAAAASAHRTFVSELSHLR